MDPEAAFTRVLLDPPDDVVTMDLPADPLAAGRFGGPPSTSEMFPARPIILVLIVSLWFLALAVLAFGTLPVWLARRRCTRMR